MDVVSLLQVGSAFLLNLGFTWLVGAWFARRWIQANGARRNDIDPELRRLDLWAAGLAACSSALALLAATAVMAGVGLGEACPMFWMMLTSTAYGQAGCVTIAAMVTVLILRWTVRGRGAEAGVAVALALFAVTRASMGHAGEAGLLSAALAAEAVHYAAIGLWTGAVLLSGCYVLSERRIGQATVGASDRYLERMSQAALAAVIAIFMTGVYSAWLRVGSAEHLQHTFYGVTLLIKVALVLLAIALGGYNKFFGLPAASRSQQGLRAVRTTLRLESAVLISAVLAASILISQTPPAAM
ncbi:CopD family protein [Duganella sp.]|uniref:copper resistance D family protein n=1 Tax=Duganella sp. TaxID=1904440 RepID=UPI0031D19749